MCSALLYIIEERYIIFNSFISIKFISVGHAIKYLK